MNIIRKMVGYNRGLSKKLLEKYPLVFGSVPYKTVLMEGISKSMAKGDIESVLEVGGIDRPLLAKGQGFEYDGLDIESRERCFEIYDDFFVQSIENCVDHKYDMVISITLLEHVPDNISAMQSIYSSLNPGGVMHHYVPSKWHPYSVALRLVGPVVQKKLIPILRPGAEVVSGYPAFFNHCSVSAMRSVLNKQGFTDIEFKAFYRANDYFAFLVPLFVGVSVFENICKKFDFSFFASGFVVSAKR